jgi:TrmH family RNA methyltransferase
MGTIIRLADWFAVPHIVCTPGCADPYNPKVVQSTMASLARVNIWMDKDGSWIEDQKAPLFAAALNGNSLYAIKPPQEGILMIGNESKGLNESLLQRATQKITIPKRGGAESLNAAVATGIILAHLTR